MTWYAVQDSDWDWDWNSADGGVVDLPQLGHGPSSYACVARPTNEVRT